LGVLRDILWEGKGAGKIILIHRVLGDSEPNFGLQKLPISHQKKMQGFALSRYIKKEWKFLPNLRIYSPVFGSCPLKIGSKGSRPPGLVHWRFTIE
jgi:hypothetical protein